MYNGVVEEEEEENERCNQFRWWADRMSQISDTFDATNHHILYSYLVCINVDTSIHVGIDSVGVCYCMNSMK